MYPVPGRKRLLPLCGIGFVKEYRQGLLAEPELDAESMSHACCKSPF